MKWIIVIIIVFAAISGVLDDEKSTKSTNNSKTVESSSSNTESNSKEEIETDEKENTTTEKAKTAETKEENTIKLKFGELLSTHEDTENSRIVIKAKITPNLTNKMTIQQNAHSIEDFILNQGGDKYTEIQYWAVADMTDGSEAKVISFTLDNDLIKKVKNRQVVATTLLDNVSELWILPSLKS